MLKNFIAETCNAPGTSAAINLAGPATDRLPITGAASFPSGSVLFYFMDDGTQVEAGYGTVTAGSPNTFSRDVVLWTSALGNASPVRLNFTGSTKIWCEVPAERLVWRDGSNNVALPAALSVAGALSVSGTATAAGALTVAGMLTASGAVSVAGVLTALSGTLGALSVSGAVSLASVLSVTGVASLGVLNASGLISGAAGLAITGNGTFTGSLTCGAGGSFAGSTASPGYQKMPGGRMLQFGTGVTNGSGFYSVSFPTSFPSAFQGASVTVAGAAGPAAFCPSRGNAVQTAMDVWIAIASTGAPAVGVGFDWEAWGV